MDRVSSFWDVAAGGGFATIDDRVNIITGRHIDGKGLPNSPHNDRAIGQNILNAIYVTGARAPKRRKPHGAPA